MANEKVYTDYLMHGRTKGSRNGISTTKGYTAVGQKAKGRWINGRYVYYEDEAKQRAFRQGLAEARGRNSAYENQAAVNRMENARKADVLNQKIYGKKIKGYTRLADISPYEKQRRADKYLSSSTQHQAAVNQHNAEVAGKNAAYEYARKQKARKATSIGASQAADTARMNSEVFNRVLSGKSNSAIVPMDKDTKEHYPSYYTGKNKELKSHVKPEYGKPHVDVFNYDDSSRASLKKGAQNNWQQQANAAASGKPSGYNNAHYNAVSQAAAERKVKEAALKRQQKASMQNAGKKNNWQQQANATAGKGRTYDKVTESGIHYDSDLGVNQWRGSMSQKQKDARKTLNSKTKAAKAESQARNSRSDIGNAYEDFKQDAKNTFKYLKSKFKKKKK